jgi:uncharacterized protein
MEHDMRDALDMSGPVYRPMSPWGPWEALGLAAAILLASYIVGALLGGLTVVSVFGTELDWKDAKAMAPAVPYFLPGMLAAQVIGTLLTWQLCRQRRADARMVLALREPTGRWLHWAAAICAVILATYIFMAVLLSISGDTGGKDQEQILQMAASPMWPALFLVAVVGAPISEEFLFRGFLFPAFARTRMGLVGASVATSALWAVIHAYTWQGNLMIFFMGLLLSLLLVRSGSLWVPIYAHAAFNFTSFAMAMGMVQNGVPGT